MHALKHFIAFTFAFSTFLHSEMHSGHSQSSNTRSSERMLGLQAGYAWIQSKDVHMEDDSGPMIGIHIMQHVNTIPDSKHCHQHRLSWAAGLHKTFTKDPHYGAMVGLMYALSPEITLSFMPGYIWMKHDSHSAMQHSPMAGMGAGMPNSMHSGERKWESEYATHFEFTFSLNAFNQNFKPSLSWMTSDSHELYSLGLNFSF